MDATPQAPPPAADADPSPPDMGRPRLAVVSATTAVVALVGGWTWAAAVQPGDFDQAAETVSALAASTTPRRWVMTTGLVVTGLAHLVTAWALRPAERRGRFLLAAGGVATLLVAALPLPTPTASSLPHTVAAGLAFGLLAVWPWLAARPGGPAALSPPVSRLAAAILTASVVSWPLSIGSTTFGLHERVVATLVVTWPLVAAVSTWWWAGHRIGPRRARRALETLVLTVACATAGVAATAAFPATAETRHYSAEVWLDPDPRFGGELAASTTFGDVVLDFPGIAPGVRAVPQVEASIADVLARPGVTLTTLQPGPEELNEAIRGAGVDVLGRFVLGAVGIAALVVGGSAAVRRRRPQGWLVVSGVVAVVVSTGATTAATLWTYQPSRQPTFTTTGVLGTIQQNENLFGDVEQRAAEATPYVRNLIALSTALQERYAAEPLTRDVALRVLLVSDVHAGNQYALMRSVVEAEDVDLVVDTGDLLTFGTVQEGEVSGVFDGIASLGVPYLFVRGNHDATGPTDTAVLSRLDQISNVVLLQPASGDYTEVEVGGLRITGFNDPRWFGDSGTGSREAQVPARDTFAASFEGRPAPDLLLTHEPWALDGLEGGVLVNGHMHIPDLEGNRVQVGTFTGGGPFSYYLNGEGGEELVGQPSAFDVLAFGTDCRLASLTRFQFRDVVEGRPAYDDVSLVNGRRVDDRDAEPGRVCTAGAELSTVTVPAVRPD
ncbi:MAG: DUF998 domain-containing protein [Dermatophilaceae bacterium]